MRLVRRNAVFAGVAALFLSGCALLTGCSLSPTGEPSPEAGLAINGSVHGGQQAIVGAQVYLFAANTTGYGNASVSLLTSVAGSTLLDSSGGATNGDYYVTTGANGSFSISGDYTCTANSQVYLYALGGNPGLTAGTDNTASGLLAALGNCPSAGNLATATPFILVNEVSTIAAAYAFAGFATDATHVSSSGTALAQTGIANAFANATNLETLSTGVALATTPAGNGTVPQATINTLANILAACVNSNGAVTGPATPTACYTLFNNALSGGSSGTTPSDTATAAINIARHPAANLAALYGLSTANPPFGSALSAQPNDFTIMLTFTGGGLSVDARGIAIDGSGNVWTMNSFTLTELSGSGAALSPSSGYTGATGRSISTYGKVIAIDTMGDPWELLDGGAVEFSKTGSLISSAGGYTGGGLTSAPSALVIDGASDAWIANGTSSFTVAELSSSGAGLSPATPYPGGFSIGNTGSYGIAIDGSGKVWVAGQSAGSVVKLSSVGALLSPVGGYTGGGLDFPQSLVVDGSGNVWVVNSSSSISEFSNAGLALSPSAGFTGGGLASASDLAIDGAGNVWIANLGRGGSSVSELSSSGVALSPSNGFVFGDLFQPLGIAVDGSGNVWLPNGNSSVSELIGAATPVVTPIAVGAKNNTLGTRP